MASTWNDNYPPPPRRSSRSRSPGTRYGGRAGYDSRYSDYGGRDRDWEYERYYGRDSPVDSRRGRSRSPGTDIGKKRRRSPSPWERDRYDPRPRYNDDYDTHSRGYGGYSPRRGSYPPRARAPPDPHTFDYPGSLKQFADWFRFHYSAQAVEEDNLDKLAEQEAGDGSKPRNGIKTLWEKYKKDFTAGQLQTMFDHHRKSPWFAEKYEPSPETKALRERVRKIGWKGRAVAFLRDLDTGKYDPVSLQEDIESAVKKETEAKEEVNGADESRNGDDDMQFNIEPDDDVPESDNQKNAFRQSGRDRGTDRGEEVEAPTEGQQVMIRTIPPDIGRIKLEGACQRIPGYVYLALGDPMQKRNFYRAGWLRFDDDADIGAVMSELSDVKIEGFKLHVSHITRPFVNRVRYTPDLASRPDRLKKDLENAITLAAILEEQAAQYRQLKIPREKPTASAEEVKVEGEEAKVEQVASEQMEEEEEEEEPVEKGADAIERRVERILSDMREQGLIDLEDEADVAAKKTVITLDLYLEYLRAAFNTCYYCALTTDHVEELQRKCVRHLRRPLSIAPPAETNASEETNKPVDDENPPISEGDVKMADAGASSEDQANGEKKDETKDGAKSPAKPSNAGRDPGRDWKRNDDKWLEWLDAKIALLIHRDTVDPRDYGGRHYDDELSKAVAQYIKQEDEGKFRCKVTSCQKLFKATSFVEKHIANKHSELVTTFEDELTYFNNFALDPHRIQPLTHPPPPVGNASQAPPPQAFGVQFNAYSSLGGGGGRGGDFNNGSRSYYPDQGSNWGGRDGGRDYYRENDNYGGRRGRPNDRFERMGGERMSGGGSDYGMPDVSNANLPAKPVGLDQALSAGNGGRKESTGGGRAGPPPPPPPDAKEDPRAAAGKRVSYYDMDLVAEGDVELSY